MLLLLLLLLLYRSNNIQTLLTQLVCHRFQTW